MLSTAIAKELMLSTLKIDLRKQFSYHYNWKGNVYSSYPKNNNDKIVNAYSKNHICNYCNSLIQINLLNCQNCGASLKGK